jgi:hypothetical protein
MNRDSSASLSANELDLLLRIGNDPRQSIPDGYRRLFLSMKLIQLNADQMTLTGEGRRRLQGVSPREDNIQQITGTFKLAD